MALSRNAGREPTKVAIAGESDHLACGLDAGLPLAWVPEQLGSGEEAYAMGLAEVLVPQDRVRDAAIKLATEIGDNSPLGLIATRMTKRNGIADSVRKATDHELEEQSRLRKTEDFKEGVNALSERRTPNFKGR